VQQFTDSVSAAWKWFNQLRDTSFYCFVHFYKRQIQYTEVATRVFSLYLPTTRKEVKRIIRSRNNGRIRLKYLRGHLPHIWIFTSRACNVEAWANGRENRRLSMRNIFQFWCPGECERVLPQERKELSSFICVTRLYSCTVFQQILSPRAASKVGCVWSQSSSHICHPFI